MIKSVEKSAKTIDDAVEQALEELGAARDEVRVEVIEEGSSRGFLGIGKKEAQVRVTILEDGETADIAQLDSEEPIQEDEFVYYGDDENEEEDRMIDVEDKSVEFVAEILSGIGIHGKLDSYHQDNAVYIEVTGQDCGHAIGRGGDTLDAISYLTSLVANKDRQERVHIHLDIGGYRKRREDVIVERARKTANRVLRYGRALSLDPMNPAERRTVHFALQSIEGIETHSEGSEPERRIVITPNADKEAGSSRES